MHSKVQEIIDIFNLLSPENKGAFFEWACNALKFENSIKKTADHAPEHEGEMLEKDACDARSAQTDESDASIVV